MPPDFLLDRASRDAAIDNLGDLSRAEALLSRLKQGEPVTLAAVGGSITAGHGAWGPAKNSGWSRVLFDALEQRWPARPGSQHTYANGAIPAVPPPYFLACLHDCIPAPVDMLLIELAANSDATRRNHIGAIEALIRRALTWPGAPLVLLIDWTDHWGWPISNGRYNRTAAAGSAAGSDRHFSRASRQASSRAARGPFFAPKPHSDWDYYAVSAPRINRHLSSYYRVPHLSTSAALWHHDRSDTIGLRHEEIAADWNHPNTKVCVLWNPHPRPSF